MAVRLIGLAGFARSGKNAIARALGGVEFAFAAELKRRLNQSLPDSINLLDPELCDGVKSLCRPLMVEYGELIRRLCGENYWVDVVMVAIEKARLAADPSVDQLFIVTDVRKLNEANAIRQAGGKVALISRNGVGPANLLEAAWLSDILAANAVDFVYDNATPLAGIKPAFMAAMAAAENGNIQETE